LGSDGPRLVGAGELYRADRYVGIGDECRAYGCEPGDPFVVRVYLRDGRPVVEAWDRSNEPPVVRAADDLSESGRGLLLMTQMVSRWGTRPLNEGGKVVWAEIEPEPLSGV
jgi:hypothetical protein